MIICKKCGNRNEDKDQFCASCGAFLEWSGERVKEAAPPPPPAPEPAPRPGPTGIVERVKHAVGIEGKEEAPATPAPAPTSTPTPASGGGWVPPASVAGQPAAGPQAAAPPTVPAPPPAGAQAPVPPQPPAPPAPPEPPTPPPAAEPESRRPEAIPPTVQRPRPAPRTAPAPAEPQESGVFCTRCGMSNDTRRHFCRRCGSPLVQLGPRRTPWYRRLLPRRRAPAAGERHAPMRTATVGGMLRTFVATLLAVVLAGGLLAYAAVPGFRQSVNLRADTLITQVRRQLGAGIVEVHPVSARASSELSGHASRFAADLIDNDYWAADAGRDPQPTLLFTFDGKTDLDYLLITSGASGTDFAHLARPKSVQLVYSDGTGEQLTLKDDPKPTTYTVHARQVSTVTLKILDVYPVSGTSAVGVTEVEFYHLK